MPFPILPEFILPEFDPICVSSHPDDRRRPKGCYIVILHQSQAAPPASPPSSCFSTARHFPHPPLCSSHSPRLPQDPRARRPAADILLSYLPDQYPRRATPPSSRPLSTRSPPFSLPVPISTYPPPPYTASLLPPQVHLTASSIRAETNKGHHGGDGSGRGRRGREAAVAVVGSHALLELRGADRPGLLSEVFTVLHDLHCDIVDARRSTHGGHVVALVFVRNKETGASIDDVARIRCVKSRLRHGTRCAGPRQPRQGYDRHVDWRLQLLNEDGDAAASQSSTPSYLASLFVWFLFTTSNMSMNCLIKMLECFSLHRLHLADSEDGDGLTICCGGTTCAGTPMTLPDIIKCCLG
jgi:predicted amino acid-binding ACT domain protein